MIEIFIDFLALAIVWSTFSFMYTLIFDRIDEFLDFTLWQIYTLIKVWLIPIKSTAKAGSNLHRWITKKIKKRRKLK